MWLWCLCPLAATSKKFPGQLCSGGSPSNEPWAVKFTGWIRLEETWRLSAQTSLLKQNQHRKKHLTQGCVHTAFEYHQGRWLQAPSSLSLGFASRLLLFPRKFLLHVPFSLCCGCHRNISRGSIWGFLWLGRSAGAGSALRTGWIPVAAFGVGCQELTPAYPKGMHSCLLQPDRCSSPFECEWAHHTWDSPLLYKKGAITMIPDVRDVATYLDRGHTQLLKKKKKERKEVHNESWHVCTRGHLLMWSGANLWS